MSTWWEFYSIFKGDQVRSCILCKVLWLRWETWSSLLLSTHQICNSLSWVIVTPIRVCNITNALVLLSRVEILPLSSSETWRVYQEALGEKQKKEVKHGIEFVVKSIACVHIEIWEMIKSMCIVCSAMQQSASLELECHPEECQVVAWLITWCMKKCQLLVHWCIGSIYKRTIILMYVVYFAFSGLSYTSCLILNIYCDILLSCLFLFLMKYILSLIWRFWYYRIKKSTQVKFVSLLTVIK